MSVEITAALFQEYDGFSDSRIKKLESGDTFCVDDRDSSDQNAQKKLFHWFCSIFATVGNSVEVMLTGGVPVNSKIEDWAIQNKFSLSKPDVIGQRTLKIDVNESSYGKLFELADLIDDITKSGARYDTPAFKYVCPRTANSLRRLATVLNAV